MVRLLGNIGLAAAVGAFVSFIVLYHILMDWRETRMGRHIMAFMTVFAGILVYITISSFFGTPPSLRLIIRAAVYWSVAVVGWWRVYLMLSEWSMERQARQAMLRERSPNEEE